MAQQDLRTWIAKLEAAGQLQKVSGAEREEEIGCIVDMHQRKIGIPAILRPLLRIPCGADQRLSWKRERARRGTLPNRGRARACQA